MASSFTWLDSSEQDRRRVLEVIDLFSQPGTLDELGIGGIRDALADRLFPGTSTIQTRAAYFLLVPWLYRDLEARGTTAGEIGEKLRLSEYRLSQALAECEGAGAGVIGSQAGRHLKRPASGVYWGGLGVWGIRRFDGSQAQYHRSVDRLRSAQQAWRTARAGSDEAPPAPAWDLHLPDAPAGFPREASFTLRRRDARYLQERIRARAGGSLLGYLIDEGAEAPWVAMPWEHPAVPRLPARLRALLEHARLLSEAHHGAALLYNLMLAEALAGNGGGDSQAAEWSETYRDRLAEWAAILGERMDALRTWDRRGLWEHVESQNPQVLRAGHRHREFVERWLECLVSLPHPGAVVSDSAARELICARELEVKRGRARLAHREYLERWGGQSGANPLDYRWGTAQTMVSDIVAGLGAGAAGAAAE